MQLSGIVEMTWIRMLDRGEVCDMLYFKINK